MLSYFPADEPHACGRVHGRVTMHGSGGMYGSWGLGAPLPSAAHPAQTMCKKSIVASHQIEGASMPENFACSLCMPCHTSDTVTCDLVSAAIQSSCTRRTVSQSSYLPPKLEPSMWQRVSRFEGWP